MSSTGSYLQHEEDYSVSHQRATPVSTMGLEKDLEGKNLPQEIKALVLQMAGSAPKSIYRMGCRSRLLFAYVYLAYLRLDYVFEPEKVAAILGIDKSQWSAALLLASGISSTPLPQSRTETITAPMNVVSPITYFDSLLPLVKMQTYRSQITDLAKKALEIDPLLYEEQPRRMAVAFIKYFLDTNQMSIPKFHTYFNMTAASIKTCVNKISAALPTL